MSRDKGSSIVKTAPIRGGGLAGSGLSKIVLRDRGRICGAWNQQAQIIAIDIT